MLNDDFPEYNDGIVDADGARRTPITIHLTVTDVDAKFQQAIDAGATVIAALRPILGDRYGVLRDPFGHHWSSVSRCARSARRRSRSDEQG